MADDSVEAIRKLEQELREVLRQGDFTDALDIIDELESKTELKAAHLATKGQCLIKLRRKQDAKGLLLRAFELDPGCGAATQLLDENFPGWTRAKAPPRPTPPPQARSQQGPPPSSGGSSPGFSLASDSGYAQPSPQSQGYPPQQTAYQAPPQQSYQTAAPVSVTGSHPGFSAVRGPSQPAYVTVASDAPVNWRYVLEDMKFIPATPPPPATEQRINSIS